MSVFEMEMGESARQRVEELFTFDVRLWKLLCWSHDHGEVERHLWSLWTVKCSSIKEN